MIKHCIAVLALSLTTSMHAQITFNTGSIQLDTDLNQINLSASANFESFKNDCAVAYHVSTSSLDDMRVRLHWSPGEIYFALELARISRRPVADVIHIYQSNPKNGWGNIAKQMGIKPGSPEFHQLKQNAGNNKSKGYNKSKGKPKHAGKGNKKKWS